MKFLCNPTDYDYPRGGASSLLRLFRRRSCRRWLDQERAFPLLITEREFL